MPAEDLETPSDHCASLEASLRRIGLPMERIQAAHELAGVLNAFLTPRPQQSRMGPAVVDTSASKTQRVTDWFDMQIGRTIQNTSANQWYGQLEPRELHEMAASMGLTPEERDRIDKAGQGEGLLVTAGRRVWVTLYGHTSPGEFAVFNTDKEEAEIDVDDVDDDRRNGHELSTLVRSSRR